nr:hypothetical protein [Tanacetum cinerariifolium]
MLENSISKSHHIFCLNFGFIEILINVISVDRDQCFEIIVVREQCYRIWTIAVFEKSQIELFFVYKDLIFESQDLSTSNTHQQSLADTDSETRPPMLESGSYIPSASRFRRYLNQKRENKKWLNKSIDEGPYEFKEFTPSETEPPRMQKEEDLKGDDLKHYEAKIEAMNLILISISNDIYNSVDACTTVQAMWQRVERLMRGTVQNKIDKETCLNNEFDQFVAEPGEALMSVYKNSGNDVRNTRRSYVQEEVIKGTNVQNDSRNIPRTLRTTSSGTAVNVQCYNCREKGHYARNYPKLRVQDSKIKCKYMLDGQDSTSKLDSDKGPSYDSAFLNEVQTPSTSYVNPLFAKDNQEQKYPKKPKIINNTIGDDQIDSNIIFDEPNGDVNSGSVKYDNNVQESYELEQLARNAYKEAEKQQIIAKKVQKQNIVLTK